MNIPSTFDPKAPADMKMVFGKVPFPPPMPKPEGSSADPKGSPFGIKAEAPKKPARPRKTPVKIPKEFKIPKAPKAAKAPSTGAKGAKKAKPIGLYGTQDVSSGKMTTRGKKVNINLQLT